MKAGVPEVSDAVKAQPLWEYAVYRLAYKFYASFSELNAFSLVIFAMMFFFLEKRKPLNVKKSEKVFIYGLSLVIPFTLLLAHSYNKINSWDLVFGNKTALVFTLFRMIGFSIPIFTAFTLVLSKDESKLLLKKTPERINFKKQFLKYAAIILILWIPYMILLAPGCFTADAKDEMAQLLGNKDFSWTQKSIILLDENVIINNHHPLLYTLILKVFMDFGKAISSYAVSFEILCILQAILLASTFSYALVVMEKRGCGKMLKNGSLAFFALNPLFPIYAMTVVKDTVFCALFVFVAVELFEMLVFEKPDIKRCACLFVTLILFMLARNNSVYLMAGVFVLLIFVFFKNKKRVERTRILKIGATVLSAILVFQVGIINILYPMLKITPGSRREILSIPAMQTARYIKEYKDEISPEEEAIILKVFGKEKDLDDIVRTYNPQHADSTKNRYNKYVTDEEFKDYIKVWLNGLKKHPDCYIEAFLNLQYPYVSFEGINFKAYHTVDYKITDVLEGFEEYSGNKNYRKIVSTLLNFCELTPVTKVFIETATYTWVFLFILIYIIKNKCYKSLAVNAIVFLNYLICFAGPVPYMRYAIPMACLVPFSIFIVITENFMRGKIKDGKNNG